MGRLIPAGTGARKYSGYGIKVAEIPGFLQPSTENNADAESADEEADANVGIADAGEAQSEE